MPTRLNKGENEMIDKNGSKLMAIVFNSLTKKQKESYPPDICLEIGDFMVENGYRFVFNKWYLQAEPEEGRRA